MFKRKKEYFKYVMPYAKIFHEPVIVLNKDGRHYESNYYATAYWMLPNDNEGRLRKFVVEGAKRKEISAEDNIETFAAVVDKLIGIFAALKIPAQFLNQDEMLTYLHSCVSDSPRSLKMPEKNLLPDNFLYDTPFYGGLEPRFGRKNIRVIVPTGYLGSSVFGMFDRLNQLDKCSDEIRRSERRNNGS